MSSESIRLEREHIVETGGRISYPIIKVYRLCEPHLRILGIITEHYESIIKGAGRKL